MVDRYISPPKPKPLYKIHRQCSICGRLIVVHIDSDLRIMGKHWYFFTFNGDEDFGACGEYWECYSCRTKPPTEEESIYGREVVAGITLDKGDDMGGQSR